MRNITIKATASCLGSTKRDILKDKEKFKRDNPDIPEGKVDHVVDDILGKVDRYHLDPKKESIYSMAMSAASECLERANLTGKDIDMIIFHSNIPEYFTPPTSLRMHHDLGCSETTMCYDTNANCVGMLLAYIQSTALMNYDKRIKRCLLVHSDYFTSICRGNDLISSFAFTDSAFAMILEEDPRRESGIIAYDILSDTDQIDFTLAPNKGSTYLLEHFEKENMMLNMDNDADTKPERTLEHIKIFLKEQGVEIKDIKGFFFSQYVKATVGKLKAGLAIPEDKLIYVGDKYGYTGANSPFLVMQEARKLGQVKQGDLCLFWTIGSAFQHAFVLARI